MPRHMLHPGSRQSKPASTKILSNPSASACSFTMPDPGTIMACTPSATFLPWAISATWRRSSIRELVQDPTKTLSIFTSVMRWPGSRPMYSRDRMILSFLSWSVSSAGSGTVPVIGTTASGEVPQVTVGAMSAALITTSWSNFAPSSDRKLFQYSTAASQCSAVGAIGRPCKYSKVFSSGATMPARAPASMAMLQMDIRASMDRSRMTLPANSITWPFPPLVPISPMTWSTTSLEVTPSLSSPSTRTHNVLEGFMIRVWVARQCSTSEVPIPKAKDPKAPCVAVWESPHTMVVPGRVKPCSGPITWTIPCLLSVIPK
mmetsp:Transcript_21344/g.51743  ORF Transcript_21344/g.51743 Transcript_21344/m.51743 type:complete len:317 (+) Transcript_21344:1001-1951(+)